MFEGSERTIRVWLNVINALLLRDIRVRAGKYYIGYLAIFLMPFAHLSILLIVFTVLNKAPPFGNQPIIFFGISMLPFVLFVYPSRQTSMSLNVNRPLLCFPRVKIIDLFVARGLLEFANGMAVAFIVCIFLYIIQGEFSPRDPLGFITALMLSLYFGFCWGAYNAIIAQMFHFWLLLFNLCFPVFWLSCGMMFYIHGLPTYYAYLLSFNPILQCVEYIRFSFYGGYPSDRLDVGYIFWLSTCLLASAMLLERISRRRLLST